MEEKDDALSEGELRELMGPAAASCIGYERNTEKEDREWKKRRHALVDEHAAKSALSVKLAREAMAASPTTSSPEAGATPPLAGGELRTQQLFGEFWREGELVVLTGRSGTGKSILAMQIAEEAAAWRAKNPPWPADLADDDPAEVPPDVVELCRELHPPAPVLYVDLERTERQRVERYSAPVNSGQLIADSASGVNSEQLIGDSEGSTAGRNARTPRKYEFAEGLEWADVGSFGHMHSRYKGNLCKFLIDSTLHELQQRSPAVAIIDNLTFLITSGRHASDELRSLMKTLRRWVNDTGTSIMLIAHSETRPGYGHIRGRVEHHAALELADRVFALMPSTVAPSFRYVKTVFPADARQLTTDNEVDVYQLGRSDQQPAFLGFEHVGRTPEEAHLRNYATHVEMLQRAVNRVEERWGGRRRKLRAPVPSKVVFKGIE
jgi:hypothetical protein